MNWSYGYLLLTGHILADGCFTIVWTSPLVICSWQDTLFQMVASLLCELVLWLFSLDRTHYSRWFPMHITDMLEQQNKHFDIHHEFINGKFTVEKNPCKFIFCNRNSSSSWTEQWTCEGDGRAIGLTENDAVIDEIGNPIDEEGQDLISLSAKDITDQSVCSTVRQTRK